MKDKDLLRILVIILILFLILNIVLLALNKISALFFWIVLIIIGIFAYKYLPKMKK